jgi:hypothetical protein
MDNLRVVFNGGKHDGFTFEPVGEHLPTLYNPVDGSQIYVNTDDYYMLIGVDFQTKIIMYAPINLEESENVRFEIIEAEDAPPPPVE